MGVRPVCWLLAGLVCLTGCEDLKNQLKNTGAATVESDEQPAPTLPPEDAPASASSTAASNPAARPGLTQPGLTQPAAAEPTTAGASPAPQTTFPSSTLSAQPISLKYDWQQGQKYAYRFQIEADKDDLVEVLRGTPVYTVKQRTPLGIKLSFQGRLSSSRESRSGAPLPPDISRTMFSPFTGLNLASFRSEHQLTLDEFGNVKHLRGESQLPFLLGNLSLLVIQPLPGSPKREWETTDEVTIEITNSRGPGAPFGRGRPGGGRFGGPRFGGGPFGASTTKIDAEETTHFTITKTEDDLVVIHKQYELKTSQLVNGKPRYDIVGGGDFVFDRTRGVPTQMEFRMTVSTNTENSESHTPVFVSFQLLSDAEYQEMQQATKKAVPQPASPEEIERLYADIQTNEPERIVSALQRLAKTPPPEDNTEQRQSIANIMARFTQHPSPKLRQAAAVALKDWATVENVPVLIELLENKHTPARWAAIDGLGRLQAPSAIEPLAKRLPVGIDRIGITKALKGYGTAAESAVLPHITNKEWPVRQSVYEILQTAGTQASVKALEVAIANEKTRSILPQAKKALEAAKSH